MGSDETGSSASAHSTSSKVASRPAASRTAPMPSPAGRLNFRAWVRVLPTDWSLNPTRFSSLASCAGSRDLDSVRPTSCFNINRSIGDSAGNPAIGAIKASAASIAWRQALNARHLILNMAIPRLLSLAIIRQTLAGKHRNASCALDQCVAGLHEAGSGSRGGCGPRRRFAVSGPSAWDRRGPR